MREYKSSITNERNESVHFAPLALSNSTMRACPFASAIDNGVTPSFIFALTLAPFLSSTVATRMWPQSNSINAVKTKQQNCIFDFAFVTCSVMQRRHAPVLFSIDDRAATNQQRSDTSAVVVCRRMKCSDANVHHSVDIGAAIEQQLDDVDVALLR